MTEITYIGIDPGAKGGIACLQPDGSIDFTSIAKLTKQRIWNFLNNRGDTKVVMEKVNGYMGAKRGGGNDTKGSHMFTFGESYGFLQGCLVGHGLEEGKNYWMVFPRTWQSVVGMGKGRRGEIYEEHKRRLKKRAEQLFPQLKVTLETADALLLAHYCKETYS